MEVEIVNVARLSILSNLRPSDFIIGLYDYDGVSLYNDIRS